jgi:thymidylate kinase
VRFNNRSQESIGAGPSVDVLAPHSEIPTPPTTLPSLEDCLQQICKVLDEENVRYCLPFRWNGFPDCVEANHDLELMIHPNDAAKVPSVIRRLGQRGYRIVQLATSGVNAYVLVFAWFETLALKTVVLNLAFEHRESGFVWNSGQGMVAARLKTRNFWVADPATELNYVLLKYILNGALDGCDERRLQALVEEVGHPATEKIACQLAGKNHGKKVVAASQECKLGALLRNLKPVVLRQRFRQHPVQAVRCFLSDAWNLGKRWLQPTGLCFVLLGPDGVGKSTLVAGMIASLSPIFRRHEVFHWRPGVLVPIRDGDASLANPHDDPPRSGLVSTMFLFGLVLDFWAGYLLRTRALLTGRGLVIFDRYYCDLLVDQKRYRYGGPIWLLRWLLRVVPGRQDLVLILDAPEEVILSRKRQLLPEELKRQRAEYRALTKELPNACVIETQHAVEQVLAVCCRVVMEHLARRLESQRGPSAVRHLTQTVRGSL